MSENPNLKLVSSNQELPPGQRRAPALEKPTVAGDPLLGKEAPSEPQLSVIEGGRSRRDRVAKRVAARTGMTPSPHVVDRLIKKSDAEREPVLSKRQVAAAGLAGAALVTAWLNVTDPTSGGERPPVEEAEMTPEQMLEAAGYESTTEVDIRPGQGAKAAAINEMMQSGYDPNLHPGMFEEVVGLTDALNDRFMADRPVVVPDIPFNPEPDPGMPVQNSAYNSGDLGG